MTLNKLSSSGSTEWPNTITKVRHVEVAKKNYSALQREPYIFSVLKNLPYSRFSGEFKRVLFLPSIFLKKEFPFIPFTDFRGRLLKNSFISG